MFGNGCLGVTVFQLRGYFRGNKHNVKLNVTPSYCYAPKHWLNVEHLFVNQYRDWFLFIFYHNISNLLSLYTYIWRWKKKQLVSYFRSNLFLICFFWSQYIFVQNYSHSRFIKEVRFHHELAKEDVADYIGNPINAFTLIKRMVSDWKELYEFLKFRDVKTGKFYGDNNLSMCVLTLTHAYISFNIYIYIDS